MGIIKDFFNKLMGKGGGDETMSMPQEQMSAAPVQSEIDAQAMSIDEVEKMPDPQPTTPAQPEAPKQ